MKKRSWKRGLAVAMGVVLGVSQPAGTSLRVNQAYAYTERSAKVSATTLNVRSGPGTSNASVARLNKNSAVTVIGETTGSDGKLWYQIRFTGTGGQTATGYVLGTYVSFPASYSHDGDFEASLNAQGFPESYKNSLRQLHAKYPQWRFEAQHTGLDWNTVIQNEAVLGRNLVHTGSISSYKSLAEGAYNWDNGVWTGFDGSTCVAPSEDILRFYTDPWNFLDEAYIFQFMSQKYDPAVHTREGLQSMLKGSFMENGQIGAGGSGSSSAGPGGSSGGSSTGGSPVVGPGVSGGSSSVPGGQSAVIVGPGSNGSSSGTASQPSGNAGSQAPSDTSDSEVRFEGPHASVSKHQAAYVASNVITAGGPGASSGNSSSPGAAAPGGVTSGGGNSSGATVSYVDAIMNAASASGVNPYVIAAMIIQEQGRDGRGNSISGNYAGYTGVYNYFNVGAYASDGMGAVERGLWYASQSGTYGRPWNSPESSILGGAQFYGTNYVNAGQDTLYLKKYNVQGSNMYKHQYMTNVDGAASEGSIFAEGFSEQLKNTALTFKIPVYTNMPESPCVKPTVDGSPNNKLKGLGAEGFTLTPTFDKDTLSYDLIVDHSVSSVNLSAVTIDSKASVSGVGTIQLQSGNNEIPVVVRAENGTERTYTIHVVRQTNGPTYNAGLGSGITVTPGNGNTGSSGSSVQTGGSSGGPGISNSGPGISNVGSGSGGGSQPGFSAPGSTAGAAPGGQSAVIVAPGN